MPFARVCGKMRWQFGGNLQPVRMICEFDWKECPSAIISYIWSEIVTDVVDCLTNEWLLWRVIAMLFVCSLLVYTIYSKTRLMDETSINRENLNVVGCKVQDLELKVNILTYKMQYGTWPLPRQIRGTGIESGLRNVRLTLTNSSDRNAWLKHMLLSPSENNEFVPFAKIGPRSVRCLTKLINLETKYMSSRFSRDASPASNKQKSSSSERSIIKYEETSKNSSDSIEDTSIKKLIPKSENLGTRQKDSPKSCRKETNCWSETQVLKYRKTPKTFSRSEHYNFNDQPSRKKFEEVFANSKNDDHSIHQLLKYNPRNSTKKFSASSRKFDETKVTSSELSDSKQLLKYREHSKYFPRQQNESTKKLASIRKSEEIDKSPEERVHSTHETLHQVKEKLENLHSVLRIYGSPEAATKAEEATSGKELAESILQDLKNLGNLPTESESDCKTSSYVPQLLDSNTEDSQCPKEEAESTSEFEQCRSDRDSSSARSYGCNEIQEKDNTNHFDQSTSSKENMEINKEEKTTNYEEKKSPETEKLPDVKMYSIESSDDENRKSMRTEHEDPSHILSDSSQTELSKDSDIEDKSNAALLREALKFKAALLSQIKSEKEVKSQQIEESEERKYEENDVESDEPQWSQVKNYFQSKLLDIISEEQSASSSTEKTSKTFAVRKDSLEPQKPNENLKASQADPTKESNENPPNSRLALVSESSEYFSLSNLEEKLIAQTTVSLTRNETIESSSDFTEDEKEDNGNLHKNISDLVNQSVQNIREYIEVFSQMQNDAIVETKQAITDDHQPIASNLKDCSSEDSIMHFVNTVAMADSVCEQLPRKLSEPLINSLLDLETMDSDEESPESLDYKPDFTLKRRPGSIALAKHNNALSTECLDARSLFESAHSEIDNDDKQPLSSEPSCKELLMDYSPDSDSDFIDEKLSETLNLIEFDEDNVARTKDDWDEKMRIVDSPLTGRTVIRATRSSTSYLLADSTNSFDLNSEMEEKEKLDDKESISQIVPETSSVYFTDDISISEVKAKSTEVLEETLDNLSESSTWILENPRTNVDTLGKDIEAGDSAISETTTESIELSKNPETIETDNYKKRLDSGKTIVKRNNDEKEAFSKANLSSDTSGTYMDASSRDYLNSSGISLAFDKSLVNSSSNRIEASVSNTSARGSSSSPLQQRIPWNAPKRGSSLNNASSTRSKKPEKCSSKQDKSKESSTSDKNINKWKPTRSQSSGGKEIKARSNLNLSATKDLESSSLTSNKRSGKSSSDLPERRSRSYVTPRKSEASPRDSATSSQIAENPRQSRTRKDVEKSKTSIELSKYEKSNSGLVEKGSSKSCVTKTSSKSCIPILKSRLENVRQTRAKSPMRGPLTMSMSSWSQEPRSIVSDSLMENKIRSEGNPENIRNIENTKIASSKEPYETIDKIDQQNARSTNKIPESRTVIYVNIVTEHEHSATRVVDPKKFLEYLKDRDLKIQTVLDQEIGVESSLNNTAERGSCGSPRVLTVVSSAVNGQVSSDGSLKPQSNNSAITGSWSLRVEQREIEVSAKPSVLDTSTSISDLPEISMETRQNLDKFKIFEVPKELTKDEYIVLLEALNQDPNLHQLREMHKLCNKLGLGFHE